jgi:hypothetical protein
VGIYESLVVLTLVEGKSRRWGTRLATVVFNLLHRTRRRGRRKGRKEERKKSMASLGLLP